jgi:hypothetical protein
MDKESEELKLIIILKWLHGEKDGRKCDSKKKI